MNLHVEEDILLAKVSTIRKAVATIRSLGLEHTAKLGWILY